MTQCFADSAAQCAGLAAQVLGWRPRTFWAATPAELALSLGPLPAAASPTPPSRAEIARLIAKDQCHG
ncbi:phage tail assembly chaperone [Qipengyuania sp. SM2507]